MLRKSFIALLLMPLVSCDSGPALSPEAKTLHACFAKRGLTVEKFLVFATAEISYTLCHDKLGRPGEIDERGIALSAALADYVVDEVPGSPCAAARRALIDPIRERIAGAFRKDGADVFCAWVRRMHDQQSSELWSRFWR